MDDGTASPSDERFLLSPRRVLCLTGAGVSLIAVCYGLARFAYGMFLPVFRREFSLDATTAGAIASGSYIAYCVAILVATVLTPRWGGRAVATVAGVTATVGVLMVATAPTAPVLAVGVLIAGSSTGIASPPLAHAVAHTVAPRTRDRVQTVINAGTGLGVALAGPIALVTSDRWRTAWVAFALLCALVTVWSVAAVPSNPAHQPGPGGAARLLPRPLLASGGGRLVAVAALMGAASAAVWTFGRDVLVSEGGMGELGSSIAWILLGACGVLGAAAGGLAQRFGIGTCWTATMLVLAAATCLIAWCPATLAVAGVAAAAFGAAYIALTGLLLIWGTHVYPGAPAAGVGLAFLVIALGQAVGAPIVGALSQSAGAVAAFSAAGITAAVGAFVRPAARRG